MSQNNPMNCPCVRAIKQLNQNLLKEDPMTESERKIRLTALAKCAG